MCYISLWSDGALWFQLTVLLILQSPSLLVLLSVPKMLAGLLCYLCGFKSLQTMHTSFTRVRWRDSVNV